MIQQRKRPSGYRGGIPVLFVFFFLTFVIPLAAASPVDDFVKSPSINAPHSAVLIKDLKSGATLAAHNTGKPLVPASIMKSVTIATLLQKTGADYTYRTPVYLDGKISGTRLDGNIRVVASGDPSVNTANEPHTADLVREIASALKERGITAVEGTVTVDEKGWTGPCVNPAWSAGDLPHSYGTGTHGFNFEDNACGKKSVADPAKVFAAKLKAALKSAGITINDIPADAGTQKDLLLEHISAPADEIMRSCMMRSDNQFAEAMLRLVGKEYGKGTSTAEGASCMRDYWKKQGAALEGVAITDGSGLSRTNRVTARFMADVLERMHGNPYYASFFPLAGQEGTLRRLLKGTPLEGMVAMKTGSMKGIQCYAGYKLDDDYSPTHLIVVIMNEMGDRAAAVREVEKLLLATFPSSAGK